jgi:hypothetical protein
MLKRPTKKSKMKSIASEICCSLVEVQQLLEQHGVTDAAEYIERGRNLIMRAKCNTKKPTRQITMDTFLMK